MSDVQIEPQEQSNSAPMPDDAEVQSAQETSKAPDHSWVPKRISEITAARRAAEARAAELEAEVARLRAAQQAPEDHAATTPAAPNQSVDQLARAYAERMVREQRDQESMNSRIAAINEAGAKEFGEDFEKSVQNLNMAGIGGPEFLKVLTSVKGAEKIVTWLGKSENLNEAMRIAALDPVQMGIEMTELSTKAAKALSKQISKAPPPIQPVDGGGGGSDVAEPDPSDTKKWMEWRRKNARRR